MVYAQDDEGFAWHKTTKHGKSHLGMGHWTRDNTEDCLFAVRGKPKRANADVASVHRGALR
jgi:N6-adenosine-specific RNA methylase IME4